MSLNAQEIFDNHLELTKIYNLKPFFGENITNTASSKFPKNLLIISDFIMYVNDDDEYESIT